MFRVALIALACVSLAMVPALGSPTATPMPGGANQVSGVSGKVGDTLFNGIVRLQVVEVRDATAADHPETMLASADQRVMVMTAVVRNGLHSNFIDLIRYSLADKDDVASTKTTGPSNSSRNARRVKRRRALRPSASCCRRRPQRRPRRSDRAAA
jgi:hypothetical protein